MNLLDTAIAATRVVIAPCSFCKGSIVAGQAMDSTTASGEDVMSNLHHANAADCIRAQKTESACRS